MMVLQLLWVHWMVPETRGVPLEEIQKGLGIRDESRTRFSAGSAGKSACA